MSITRIKVENLAKQYRLGEIGTGTLSHDVNRWWAKVRGKEDPFALVGGENDRTKVTTDEFVWALEDINFEVKQGEILGIIGKNGAGKSTLLKILSKVTGPTKGQIKINGRIGALLEVGTGMHPELTGIENIFLNGAILGMTKKEISSKLDEIIEFAGIAKYANTPFKRYSSGMRVRLGFAVAAFLEPEILIVDEVLAVGDYEFQKKAIGKMKDVSENQGRTVLFVSHNLAAIRNLCTKGLLLENGKIVFQGTQNETIERYQSSGKSLQEIEFATPEASIYKNNIIQLLKLKIETKGLLELKISSGFNIELGFNHVLNNENLAVTIEVKTLDELIVFHHGYWICSNNDSKEGVYTLNAAVPPDTLNAGKYKLSLIIATSVHNVLFKKEDVLEFEIKNETLANNNNILPGVLRPKIEYSHSFKTNK